tara:strand:- start:1096 stop:2808 length:1713 start_codon:yes stop_codon:yes gene_type:complete
MTITIGINANHADSSICIFEENKLIFAIEEERINRIKHWAGVPFESIKLGIDYCKIKPHQISNITLNTNPLSNLNKKIFFYLKNYLFSQKSKEIFYRQKLKIKIKDQLSKFIGNKDINFHYIDHHLSHISSAFYPSNFDRAVGISIDGFGDFCSCVIAQCEKSQIKIIDKIFFPNSIGVFYEAMTQLIGFRKYGEEYKMMGLSSYGSPKFKSLLKKNLFVNQNLFQLNTKFFNHTDRNFKYLFSGSPEQNSIFNKNIFKLLDINEEDLKNHDLKCDLASSAQFIFEEFLQSIMHRCQKKKFSNNLVYAGGCALNSLANKKLFDHFENVFIPYAPGDSGGSIGSALTLLSKKYKNFLNINTPYIGPRYSESDIYSSINNFKFSKNVIQKKFENKNTFLDEIVKLLMANKVIGLFNNEMEFGARALGNRSIIASPISIEMKDIINKKIKKRENFRPFAPAILEEEKHNWFHSSRSNPYMSNVEYVIEDKRNKIPAVTHFDGTGRVQSVSKTANLNFYEIINKFYQNTGVPILLNTSFNENEPIVLEPKQALSCFDRTDMDAIILSKFIILRN